MNDRLAIIDCGSNTFHLLIVEQTESAPYFKEIFRKRSWVYLAKGGIATISIEAQDRALAELSEFSNLMKEYGVTAYRCIGTSALRSADNSKSFIDQVRNSCNIEIELIDGQREAELIFKGASLASLPTGTNLIIDIGGGSVELILCEGDKVADCISLDFGISVLRSLREDSGPLSNNDYNLLRSCIELQLQSFEKQLKAHLPSCLIGTSGPFELLESMLNGSHKRVKRLYNRNEVIKLCQSTIALSLEERLNLKGMSQSRADLSVESFLIMNVILDYCISLDNIQVIDFGIKEGLIAEMLNLA